MSAVPSHSVVVPLAVTAPGARDKYLMRAYGITSAQYDALLEVYDGACWVCLKKPKPGGRRLHLEHDHRKPKGPASVRGVSCWACNQGLRAYRDNPGLLRSAANYLESSMAQDVFNRLEDQLLGIS